MDDPIDDPWDWCLDRVVQELCTENRTWQPRSKATLQPDPIFLEQALREQEITGDALLQHVSDDFMKSDMNIKALGRRMFVHSAIAELRSMSPQYQTYHRKDNPLSDGSYINRSSNDLSTTTSAVEQARIARLAQQEPLAKRQKVRDDPADQSEALFDDHSIPVQDETPDISAPKVASIEVNGKKRKRIAPTLITTVIDPNRDRQIPTDADNVVWNDPQNTSIEPGVVYIGDDGRKRLVPINSGGVSTNVDSSRRVPAPTSVSSTNAATKQAKAVLDSGYLGKRKTTADDVFYGVGIGEDLPSITVSEFELVGQHISTGRRRYIHDLMKSYLRTRSKPIAFERSGEDFYAVIPYAPRLVPKFHKPSFTLFHSENKQIRAKREELQAWPEVDPERPLITKALGVGQNHASFDLADPALLQNGVDTDDFDFLEKYRYLEGGDEVLPIYGESDSENDFDEALWNEIEAERGAIKQQPLKEFKKQPLSKEAIDSAINRGISELVAKWTSKKLPKLQTKAWHIWKKAHHGGALKLVLQKLQNELTHFIKRIESLRREIQRELWSAPSQVVRQTAIMEQTIFDLEETKFRISTLDKATCPERPLKSSSEPEILQPTQTQVLAERESIEGEGEFVESGTETISSIDDLDDFVIDDPPIASEHGLNLANSENTEASDDEVDSAISDASILQLSPKRFTPNRIKAVKIFSSKSRSNSPYQSQSQILESPTPSPTPVKEEAQAPNHHTSSGLSIIDLTTIDSDGSASSSAIDLVSPEKPKFQMQIKPKIRLVHRNSPVGGSPIQIFSDDEITPHDLPPYQDTAAISKYSPHVWVQNEDRKRLIISVLYHLGTSREPILNILRTVSEESLRDNVQEVIQALKKSETHVKGLDESLLRTLTRFIWLFEIYLDCKQHDYREQPNPTSLEKLERSLPHFERFYRLCHKLPGYFDPSFKPFPLGPSSPRRHTKGEEKASDACTSPDGGVNDVEEDDEDEDGEPLSAIRRRPREVDVSTASEDEEILLDPEDTPRKKRKLIEDESAKNLREADRQRIAEQEERRKRLRANLAKSGVNGDDQGHIIINDAKSEDQGYVLVHTDIAGRIKKHQIEGIRFMWNQIVTDEKTKQGCLLAHTMGLGKTMQVITLLVAIAQASASDDPSVVAQVPESLRRSRTLVLCPPGLVDNWMDELLTWGSSDILGDFRKIDSAAANKNSRLPTISKWYEDGGVLIMGYEMFRNLVRNMATKTRDPPLDEEQHEKVKRELLEGPNIIVADEAHKLKNTKGALASVAAQFKSKSRIALTGSPLSNSVEEYHSMIDWVAPNYLGPIREFRDKYAEPIHIGLWQDSSAYERRKSLKMLGVLKQDIAPKVHRADMSVLRHDLPPKKEFVITVPLTDFQKQAYSIYVQSMMSGGGYARTKSGDVTSTTLWHWLAILSLLCNHPRCFQSKLTERKEEVKKDIAAIGQASNSDLDTAIAEDINAPIWKVGVSQELIKAEMSLFRDSGKDMNSIELSNKIRILCQILDVSKAVGDKVLVFSQSIPTLDFLEELCKTQDRKYARLDGKTPMSKRQALTKAFNQGGLELYLISTTAGGLGLNLPGANRVVIFDFKFNPIAEEQAVGRAYRIGQKKETFVYRFVAGGTFEDTVHNKTVFKMQLAKRVVDKKSPVAYAKKKLAEFLFEPREVEQKDLDEFKGMDKVLDIILASQREASTIRAIVQTDTFELDDEDKLTAAEEDEVRQLYEEEQLKRSDPAAYHAKLRQAQSMVQAWPQNRGQAPIASPSIGTTVPLASQFKGNAPLQNGVTYPAASPFFAEQPRISTSRIIPPERLHTNYPNLGGLTARTLPTPTSNLDSPAQVRKREAPTTNGIAELVTPPPRQRPPVEGPSRGRSPVRGSSTKVRSATPEPEASPSPLSKHRPRRGNSLSRSQGSPEKYQKLLRNIESVLRTAQKPEKLSGPAVEKCNEIASTIAQQIERQIGRLDLGRQGLKDVLRLLQADFTTCQALISNQMSATALIEKAEKVEKTRGDVKNSAIFAAMSARPGPKPVPSLRTPVVRSSHHTPSSRTEKQLEDKTTHSSKRAKLPHWARRELGKTHKDAPKSSHYSPSRWKR
ncbi:hypothetical protein B0J14DRAFT_695530 [Halenospora varia]|nr:hypothetical protein B0J14DRAFT_695530 [Halenospora varia]